jgi:hypothetical protein
VDGSACPLSSVIYATCDLERSKMMLWSRLPQRDLLLGSGGLGHQALIKEGEKKSEPSCWVTVSSVIKHTIIRAGDCGCVGCVGMKHPRMTGIPRGGSTTPHGLQRTP